MKQEIWYRVKTADRGKLHRAAGEFIDAFFEHEGEAAGLTTSERMQMVLALANAAILPNYLHFNENHLGALRHAINSYAGGSAAREQLEPLAHILEHMLPVE